jgi:ribokinase
MDLVVSVNRRPAKGETVLGSQFFTNAGGKGANQAYSASKLGASVSMIGSVGEDAFGDQLLTSLQQVGVDISGIKLIPQVPTGVAFISLDETGDNSIIVAPGANHLLTPEDVRMHEGIIRESKLVMVQLEIPIETVVATIQIAKKYGVPVMLDPTPVPEQSLSSELLSMVDYILPNESEIAQLTGIPVFDLDSAERAGEKLLSEGVKTVIVKMGEKGTLIMNESQTFFIEPYRVEAIDTTSAGDAFAGSLAVALVEGKKIREAVQFASAVGAITVTRKGAQSSIPNRKEVELFVQVAIL